MAFGNFLGFFEKKRTGNPKHGADAFTEFEKLLGKFAPLLVEIEENWKIIGSWEAILSNMETGEGIQSIVDTSKKKGLLESYNKKWIAFGLALGLYKILVQNMQRFVSEKDAYLTRVKALDLELALKIEPLIISLQEGLGFLGPIKAIIDNPQLVISYMKTHYDELMQKINRMKYKTIAEDLRKIVVILSNKETEELIRCINDVKSWPYRGTYGINLYIERTFLLLNGGKSKYDGEAFLGFRLHFKDEELAAYLLKTPQFRKLMTYRQEMEFFSEARNAIQKSVKTEGKWEGFYAFYNKLDENIRKVRDIYGNEQFAKILEAFREKKHEAPIDWENELYALYEDLIKRAYQLVVEPAANALTRIFEARIKKLEEEKASALNELKKLLREKDPLYKIKKEFATILRKKRNMLLKELERERIEFNALMRDVVVELPKFETKLGMVIERTKIESKLVYNFRILQTLSAWREFGLNRTKVLEYDEGIFKDDNAVRQLNQLIFEEVRSSEIAEKESRLKNIVENDYRESLPVIRDLILAASNTFKPSMHKLVLYINSRMIDYIPEVSTFIKSDQAETVTQQPKRDKIYDFEAARKQRDEAKNKVYTQYSQKTRKAA